MKSSKLLLTLVSVATIGLSSTALMADGAGDLLRERLRDRMNIEITPELQKAIDDFRAEREQIMEEWRAKRTEHREAMVPLWEELRAALARGEDDPDKEAAVEAARKAIQEAHVAFRAANGQDLREARETFKEARRMLRERMREQLPPVEDPEG